MSIIYILMVIAMLGFLILVHEFGHFIFAKLAGVEVPEFSIGFGPGFRLFKWKETTFSIRALPLGGFVRLKGLDESYLENRDDKVATLPEEGASGLETTGESDIRGNFRYKPAPWRLLVLLGGILFNLLLAYIIFASIAFISGKTESVPVIAEVLTDMPAQAAGLMPGDIIRSADGVALPLTALVRKIATSNGAPITLVVERSGESFSVPVSPVRKEPEDRFVIGAVLTEMPEAYSRVQSVIAGSPAARAGLRKGDAIISIEGLSPTAFFARLLSSDFSGDGTLDLVVHRGNETFSIRYPFTSGADLGFVLDTRRVPISVVEAVVFAHRNVLAITRGFFGFFSDLFHRKKTEGRLTGPIGIIQIGTRAASQGLHSFFYLMAYISLVLAIVNFLPIPALDGGHVFFLLLEQAIRRRINPRVQMVFHTIGFIALLLLLVVISFFDVKNLIPR